MPSDPAPISIELSDRSLRLEFAWQKDRFAHRLICDEGTERVCIQGTAEQDWPPSPPLQQLSLEEINGVPTILGVGAAGVSHWSLSVQETQGTGSKPAFKFEFACRSKSKPEWLGSTYSCNDTSSISIDASSGWASQGSKLLASITDGKELESAETSSEEIVADLSEGETVQWSYLVFKES